VVKLKKSEWWSCDQVTDYLGVTLNNLRQLQHRQRIVWKKREGRKVYYLAEEVKAYDRKRKASNYS
jgi:hypothetical protein